MLDKGGVLLMQLPLKTSVRENPVGKNCYTGKRYNACLPPIHPDLQRKGGVLVRSARCTRFGSLRSVAHMEVVELGSSHIGR